MFSQRGNTELERGEHQTFDDPLLIEILSWLPVRDVVLNCSLVCNSWYHVCSENFLWHQLAKRDFPWLFTEREELERLREEAEKEEDLGSFSPWKQFYIHVLFGKFVWDPETASSSLLEVSPDGLTVTHRGTGIGHYDVLGTCSFSSGKHRWSVRVDKLEGHYWIGLGVVTSKTQRFTYDTPNVLGYASNGRACAPSWVLNTRYEWSSGDVIRIELDCDEHKMDFFLNGEKHRDTVPVPAGELWPWANIYNPGGTLSLLEVRSRWKKATPKSGPKIPRLPSLVGSGEKRCILQ